MNEWGNTRLSDMPFRRRQQSSLTCQLDVRQLQCATVGDRAFATGPGKKGPGKKGPGKNGPVKTVRVKTVLGKNGPGKKGPS